MGYPCAGRSITFGGRLSPTTVLCPADNALGQLGGVGRSTLTLLLRGLTVAAGSR